MSWQTILTDAGVAVAIIGLIGLLAKALIDFHASRPAAEKISVETFADVTKELDRLEKKVIDLRKDNEALHEDNEALHKRIDGLEEQLNIKETAIKQKDSDIERLQAQVNKLEARLTRVLIYVSGLLKELDDKKFQYTPPEPGVLDTDPNIQAIKGKK